MKKNYFFGAILTLFILSVEAQVIYETSLKSDENYTLNPSEGQNGWIANTSVSNLIVLTDDKSSDGTQSLHFQGDP